MPIIDIFSKRMKKQRGEVPDVYQYQEVPQALRVQIIHILNDVLGTAYNEFDTDEPVVSAYMQLHNIVAREHGVFQIYKGDNYPSIVRGFILNEVDVEKFLDMTEIMFRGVDKVLRHDPLSSRPKMNADEAIEEVNGRFKEAGFGFEYIDGKFIRIDSQHIHNEAIKPALKILNKPMYKGANQEFREAFDAFRKGDYKDCLVDALKAFESVMKAICTKRKWAFNPTDTASKLVKVVMDNGLLPSYMQSHFDGLRPLLESVATPRNKMGGHGQGATITQVPEYFARFALNMTASAIHLLASAEEALP